MFEFVTNFLFNPAIAVFNYEIKLVDSEISLLALSILLFNSEISALHSAVFFDYLASASF